MNAQGLLDPAFSGRLCVTLIHSLWQVAALAAVVWALDRLMHRRSVESRYALHVAALLMALAAMQITYAVVDVGVPAATPTEVAAETAAPPVAFAAAETPPPSTLARSTTTVAPPAGANFLAARGAPPVMIGDEASAPWLHIVPWIVVVYAAGVVLMLARLAVGMWHAQRLVGRAEPINDGPLAEVLQHLAGMWSMRVVPALARGEGIVVPKVVGLARPTILLPVSAVTALTPDELELILAHELAHVLRCDVWVNLAQRLAEVVLFFHPALWYLSRRTSTLREYCCDELALRAGTGPDAELRTRYASALLHVVELSRRDRETPSARGNVAALAAGGRLPSELRRRVARLFGEPLPEPMRLSPGGVVALLTVLAGLLAGPVTWRTMAGTEPAPGRIEHNESTQELIGSEREIPSPDPHRSSPPSPPAPLPQAGEGRKTEQRVDLSIVVARHVLLLEGKAIITWEELDKLIGAMPEPSRVYPHFYITGGAREAGRTEKAKEEMYRIHAKYNLPGHSEGSLWPRADVRYDRIQTPADLVPDESLRLAGRVLDEKGQAIAGAEVVLVTPVDESIPYKTYHCELVRGRVRNPLEHVMTRSDAEGRFALYPPKDVPFYVLVLHPAAGFALVRGDEFRKTGEIRALAWAALVSAMDEVEGEQQEASLSTRVPEAAGLPEIVFNQYWSDLRDEPQAAGYGYSHVPPIYSTTISRDFRNSDGGSTSLPAATVELLPGESRRLDLGPLSEKQREWLERIREELKPDQSGNELHDPTHSAPPPLQGDAGNGQPATVPFELEVVGPDGKPVPHAEVFVRPVKPLAEEVTHGRFVRLAEHGAYVATADDGRIVLQRPEELKSFVVLSARARRWKSRAA